MVICWKMIINGRSRCQAVRTAAIPRAKATGTRMAKSAKKTPIRIVIPTTSICIVRYTRNKLFLRHLILLLEFGVGLKNKFQ